MLVRYHIVGYADDLDGIFVDVQSCLFKRFTSASVFEAFMEMHLTAWHRSCSFTMELGTGFDGIRMSLTEKDFAVSEDHHSKTHSYVSILCHTFLLV